MSVVPRFDAEMFDVKARIWIRARLISLIIFGVGMSRAYLKMKKNAKAAKPKTAAAAT